MGRRHRDSKICREGGMETLMQTWTHREMGNGEMKTFRDRVTEKKWGDVEMENRSDRKTDGEDAATVGKTEAVT